MVEGALGVWDTSGLSHGQTYTLRLTVRADNGAQAQTSVITQIDTDIAPGWPIRLSNTTNTYIAPTVADLDNDGDKEIIVAGPDNQIRAYDKSGAPAPGFPVLLNAGDFFRWTVNVDDLDGDGAREIIAVASNLNSGAPSRIVVVEHDGSFYPGWPEPQLVWVQGNDDQTPSVTDLNGDGHKDLLSVSVATWTSNTVIFLQAFDLSGAALPGFPKSYTLPSIGFGPGELYPADHGVVSIADLDGDAKPEMAFSYSNHIYLFDERGDVLPGWPFVAPDYNGKVMLFENAAASGDLDGDGQLEVFAVGRGHTCCETQVYAWRKDGSVLPEWPKTDQTDGVTWWNKGSRLSTPVLADLNGDGGDEVILGASKITVFDQNGLAPFPVNPIATITQTSVSDVDGDGRLEFSGNWAKDIAIADDDGSSYWRRTMPTAGANDTPGLLADLDDDGSMELVLTYADKAPSLTLYVWNIPRPGPAPAAEEWPAFNYDAARSGRQRMTSPPTSGDSSAPIASIDDPADGATVSGVVDVVVSATDNVGVTRVELYVDGVLQGSDTSSPYHILWDTAGAPSDSHTLQARAYDAAGNVGVSANVMVSTPDPNSLAAPSDLVITASGNTVTLSWRDNSSNEEGFTIEWGKKVKGSINYVVIGQVGANEISFVDAKPSEMSYYRVQAFNQSTGQASAYITAEFKAAGGGKGKNR